MWSFLDCALDRVVQDSKLQELAAMGRKIKFIVEAGSMHGTLAAALVLQVAKNIVSACSVRNGWHVQANPF